MLTTRATVGGRVGGSGRVQSVQGKRAKGKERQWRMTQTMAVAAPFGAAASDGEGQRVVAVAGWGVVSVGDRTRRGGRRSLDDGNKAEARCFWCRPETITGLGSVVL